MRSKVSSTSWKDRIRQELEKRKPLWTPLPDKDGKISPQRLGYESSADVLGYGGSGGGGKTDVIIGLALTQHLRSIIFRRESTELQAIIDRTIEIVGDCKGLNRTSGRWAGIQGGRTIEFKGCKDPGDEQKHRGRPHDFIAFDEADRFSEFQFRFLTGWLRTTVTGQRCRVVLTFNPPSSADGQWLLSYFGPWIDEKHPNPAKPGELRWYAMIDGVETERPNGEPFRHKDETIQPKSRTFIPARLSDNPYLVATGYAAVLQALPEPLRSQMLHGDFAAGIKDDPWQVIPTAWVRAAMERWTADGCSREPLSALGVDVARGGEDETVLSRRYGYWFAELERHPGETTPNGSAVAALVAPAALESKTAAVNIDVIGVGASVYDHCQAMLAGNIHAINFGAGCESADKTGQLRFANMRAFAYWSMREALDPSLPTDELLALPSDKRLLADLTAPRWRMTPRGVQVEPKEEIKKRIGRSPDSADAVVLALLPTVPLEIGVPRVGKGNIADELPRGVFGRKGFGIPQW